MKLTTLEDLLVEELKDLYDGEKQITKALPKMAKAAASEDLTNAFRDHLEETKGQITRLERVFKMIGKKAGRKKCEAMQGLLEEGEEMMEQDMEPDVMDAALIAAAQRVEHYEMAGYGCVRTWCQVLGHSDAAKLLQETLDEEGDADKKLTEIAETLNFEAVSAED